MQGREEARKKNTPLKKPVQSSPESSPESKSPVQSPVQSPVPVFHLALFSFAMWRRVDYVDLMCHVLVYCTGSLWMEIKPQAASHNIKYTV